MITAAQLKDGETHSVDVGHYTVALWWTTANTGRHYTVSIIHMPLKNIVHKWHYTTIARARARYIKAQRRAAKLLAADALGVKP